MSASVAESVWFRSSGKRKSHTY